MKTNNETIRKAITKNCGGWANATNAQLMSKWRSLDEPTRQDYLKSVTTAPTPAPASNKEKKPSEKAEGK